MDNTEHTEPKASNGLEKALALHHYTPPDSFKLTGLLSRVDQLKEALEQHRPLRPDVWASIQDKLMVDWTHHSNAIEGNTLTRGETGFFLQYGLTVKGKPLKDFIDTRNHAEAIEFLFEVLKDQRAITPSLLKEFNALLLLGISHTPAVNQFGEPVRKKASPGQFKREPNHVQQPDGTLHLYVEPEQVAPEVEMLCTWVEQESERVHPVVIAALAHYHFVRIHPFDDGNGRGARLLMNLILMKKGYPPAVIRNENRQDYIEGLVAADNGNLSPFTELIAQSLIQTQEILLHDLKQLQ